MHNNLQSKSCHLDQGSPMKCEPVEWQHGQQYYERIAEAIDQHNWRRMGMGGDVGWGEGVDDELVRQYTEAVYRQYNIKNHFKDSIHASSQKSETSSKKQIKLHRKPNQILQTSQINTITPTKPPCLKKSLNRSTAIHTNTRTHLHPHHTHTHTRSKTGLTYPKSTTTTTQKQQQKNVRIKSENVVTGIGEVDVSEFYLGDGDGDELTDMGDIGKGNRNKEYLRNCRKNLRESRKVQKTIPNTYCPICEQELSSADIINHQNKCPQLTQLYNLQKQQLFDYATWKITEHLSTLNIILTNLQIKKSQPTPITQSSQQSSPSSSHQQLHPSLSSLSVSSIEKPVYIENILQQCREEVEKCLWFQEIKENF